MTEPDVCASHMCFSPSRSTGKERDTESGNDYFGRVPHPFRAFCGMGGSGRCRSGAEPFSSEQPPLGQSPPHPEVSFTQFADNYAPLAHNL
jgi:hypothetical protein